MKKFLLMMLLLCLSTLSGCKKEDPYAGQYGKKIEEDLTTTNIIDDNYRNYYEIFVPAFNDSNFDGVGDLNGVIARLDYIKDLGYNGIWLMPIHPTSSYHGYDVDDYYAVNSKYGTIEDLKNLIDECHKRGINLILDLVLNHSGRNCIYYQKACAAYDKKLKGLNLSEEEAKYQDFYVFYPTLNDIPSNVKAEKAGTKYDFYVEANFSYNMPEFNLDSQNVKNEIKKIIKYYLDMGIDGFRLDAVIYYYYGNKTKNIEFLTEFNQWVKTIKSDAYLVGECWLGYDSIKDYYASGIDSFFNFSVSVNASNSGVINGVNPEGRGINGYYNALIANQNIIGNNANGIPAPFLDNHDMPRYTYISSINKNKFTFALAAMLNGTIFSYYGDEVGMYGSNASSKPDQNVRIPIAWGDYTTPDCTAISGVTEMNYPYATVMEQIKDSNSILNYYKKVLLIRNQNPEIARGIAQLIEKDKEINKMLLISKTYNESTIGILFNFLDTEDLIFDYKARGFSRVTGQIVIDSSQYVGELKDGCIKMPPFSIVILKK